MIRELALFEECPDRVQATEDSISETIVFMTEAGVETKSARAFARAFLLIVVDQVAGLAIYFYNYSTWLGTPGVYLEDLFIRPAYRRAGYATQLLQRLAQEAATVSKGQGRLEWNCLKWNKGALDFYERLGGVRQEEWIGIRVEGEGLKKLAGN